MYFMQLSLYTLMYLRNTHASRHGIDIGDTEILVYACPMSGRRFEMAGGGQGRITLEKQWRKVLLFIASCYNLNQLSADIKIYNYKIKTRLHIMIVHIIVFVIRNWI